MNIKCDDRMCLQMLRQDTKQANDVCGAYF
jgi:hypothetical protein